MNQGLLIVLLTILLLLISCKAFNYCVLKELFVNKKQVREMMSDIYNTDIFGNKTQESFQQQEPVVKRECDANEMSVMRGEQINAQCSNAEGAEGFVNCDVLPPSIREETEECKEGFQNGELPCCTEELLVEGAQGGIHCNPNCEAFLGGFENHNVFKEAFLTVATNPPPTYLAYADSSGRLHA